MMIKDAEYKKNGLISFISYFLSAVVWAGAAILLAGTALYFGGDRQSSASFLGLIAPFLWLAFFGVCVISWVKERWVCDLLDVAVFAFLLYASFAFCMSPAKFTAKQELIWISTYASLFLTLRHTFRHRTGAVNFVVFVLFVAFIVVAYGIYHYGQPVYSVWNLLERPDYGVRMSGTFGCPNHFANFLVLSTLAAGVLLISPSAPLWLRYLSGFLAIFFSVGIFFSISRGGYVAWIFGVGFLLVVAFRRLKWPSWVKFGLAIGIPILLAVSILASNAVLERLQQRHLEDVRMALARDALVIWEQSPVIGTGPSTFEFIHPRIQQPDYSTHARYTHNDYLNLLSDYGLVGFLLVLIFFVFLVRDIRYTVRTHYPTTNHEWFYLLGWAALISAALHEAVDFNFHMPACAILFFSLMAFASMKTVHDDNRKARKSWTFIGMGLAAFFMLFTAYLSITSFMAYRHFAQNEWKIPSIGVEEGLNLAEESKEIDEYFPTMAYKVAESFRVQLVERLAKNQNPDAEEFTQREKIADAALFLYERVHRMNNLDDIMIVKQATIYDLVERYSEAYMLYRQALDKQPYNRYFYRSLGLHFWMMGELERARETFLKQLSFPNGSKEDQRYVTEAEGFVKALDDAIAKQDKP